jgi:hypothetical protein
MSFVDGLPGAGHATERRSEPGADPLDHLPLIPPHADRDDEARVVLGRSPPSVADMRSTEL